MKCELKMKSFIIDILLLVNIIYFFKILDGVVYF